ncbi:MAG: hypothetical protein OXT65_01790 [Alphaproteobacteria bacterium]|nr:hypothetical protein [Alphaproteobacteria bacterium]
MEVAAVAIQQAILQTNVGLEILKQRAQADKAIVGLVDQAAAQIAAGNRGHNLNISV